MTKEADSFRFIATREINENCSSLAATKDNQKFVKTYKTFNHWIGNCCTGNSIKFYFIISLHLATFLCDVKDLRGISVEQKYQNFSYQKYIDPRDKINTFVVALLHKPLTFIFPFMLKSTKKIKIYQGCIENRIFPKRKFF